MLVRFRISEIVLGFLLAAVFWIGVLAWSAKYSDALPQKHTAQTTEAKNQKDVTDERLADYTFLLAWFTGILALSTIGLWIVTWRGGIKQSKDMAASIKAAETAANAAHLSAEAAVAVERPRLLVRKINLEGYNTILDTKKPYPVQSWHCDYAIENYGKLPRFSNFHRLISDACKGCPRTLPTRICGCGASGYYTAERLLTS